MSSVNFYCTIILEYLVVWDINIISVKLKCLHPTFSLVTLVRGVGGKLFSLVYLAPPPPAQDLSYAVSSVNSYRTITLDYLVVTVVNSISVKLRCLHLTFSSVILVRSWFILPPAQDLGETVSSVNSYCTIILEYLVVWDINIISVKLKCLHPTFSLVTLVRGMGGKLSRLVYLAPPPPPGPGFELRSVISQFLSHHNLGIFSCNSCEHYFNQTEMFTSNVQFGYPCLRGGGKLSRLVYLASRPGFGSNSVIS